MEPLYAVQSQDPANMDWPDVLAEYEVLRSMLKDGFRRWSDTYLMQLEQRENTLIRFIAEKTAEGEKENV